MSLTPRKRFWTAARPRAEGTGFGVSLDARPLKTPSGAALVVPTEALAAAIAAEWDALDGEIRPERLPLTRAANSAIDRIAPDPAPVIDAIAEYGGSDLLCYRAIRPQALADRQAAGWDPWLAWAARSFHAPLVAVAGITHQPQPAASLAALRAAVAEHRPFALAGLHGLVALSGSLVLGLAVSRGALAPGEAWGIGRIDETFQAEQWGLDAEAEAAAEASRADFLHSARLLTLLG
ncbi:MAG: ATP12 family protein [Amaricoccus sp.]|uniref:ATP12 family chaperone protein n=1 Tax=Amaricoccus sp. TaxID=1872485 RepID=UPI0039E22FE3